MDISEGHIPKDLRSVIARFLQRLTLIAFTAHAVLGCCWHHSHVFGEESGQLSVSSTIHRCHHHDDGHAGESPATTQPTTQPTSTNLLSTNLLSVDACPCDHAHECDEARCSYVPRQANPSDGFLSVPAGDSFPMRSDLFAWIPTGFRRIEMDRSPGRRVESCQQRCANLQSWQI